MLRSIPRHAVARIAALALLLLVAAAPAPAQDAEADAPVPRGAFGEVVDVRVIDVEVVVTDAEGRRVSGLEKDDFQLFVNGLETPIAFFDEVRDGRFLPAVPAGEDTREADAAGDAPAAARHALVPTSYLLFIDDYFTRPPHRNRVLRELARDLERLAPGDLFAAVAFDGRRLEVLTDWTGSRDEVEAAVDAAQERKGWQAFMEQRSRGSAEQRARLAKEQLERTYGALSSALRAFADVPGRRVALLVSGGWAYQLTDPEEDLALARSRLYDVTESLNGVADVANATGFTLYPVDAPGQEAGPGISAARAQRRSPEATFYQYSLEDWREHSLTLLAERTGGRAALDGQRLNALERAVDDTRVYYWLGFRYDRRADGGRRSIQVEVARPGLEARFRDSFIDLSPAGEAELAAERALLLGVDDGPRLAVELGEPERRGMFRMELPFEVTIPLDAVTVLPAGGGAGRTRLRLAIAVEDKRGDRAEVGTVPLDLELTPRTIEKGEAVYDAAVRLRRLKHAVVFTLIDAATGRALSERVEVKPGG